MITFITDALLAEAPLLKHPNKKTLYLLNHNMLKSVKCYLFYIIYISI